jgi:hypothetical protein
VPGQLVKQVRRSAAKGKNDVLDALLIAAEHASDYGRGC